MRFMPPDPYTKKTSTEQINDSNKNIKKKKKKKKKSVQLP